ACDITAYRLNNDKLLAWLAKKVSTTNKLSTFTLPSPLGFMCTKIVLGYLG
ncbi:hypothetical protein SARC_17056, partial [Sphaeroforma arctica JP610]